jgi:superfamily I DNA/RNA helicase
MNSRDVDRVKAIAQYPIEIHPPAGEPGDLAQAALAVRQEHRASIKWKKLLCREVLPTNDAGVFKLVLNRTVEFDWTWEGATAFRPLGHDEPSAFQSQPDAETASVWTGEVVEVDEAQGVIFVWVSDPDRRPTKGRFFVRPFEFLAFLHALYSEKECEGQRRLLPGRLQASCGEVHPPATSSSSTCLPLLAGPWRHAWSIVWGPPGTGKTYTVGKQVAECLADSTERVLVVSTTNKSTDESAMAVGRSVRERGTANVDAGEVSRIGKGAHIDNFRSERLEGLLTGTETDLLHQVGILTKKLHASPEPEERAIIRKTVQQLKRAMKDASFNSFVSPDTRVVVSTAFMAMVILNDPEVRRVVTSGCAPFTTVVIDEAGLISRVAAAALSLLAARRVLLAGDSKQLTPISRISRILPTSQARWLASSGLSHLRSLKETHDAVCLLREQHRMHPHVSAVISKYQYDGVLENAATVRNRAYHGPGNLAGQPRSIWYVLDDDGDDYPAIRAQRGPGHRSWVRQKTRVVLAKLFSDESFRSARGLFISPFVAQARDIRAFLAEEHIDSWSASTVHSQQGTEADIVVFDTVNAGSTAWPYEDWKRLVNVALSRAKQFIIVLASRAEMREPYLRSLVLELSAQVLRSAGKSIAWTKVSPVVEFEVPEDLARNPDQLGSQIAARKMLRPVMSAEQQRLCGYRMDGKPRLVRGVAGSGKTVVLAHWLVKTLRQMGHQPELKIWAVFANRSLSGLIRDTIQEAWSGEGETGPFPADHVELWHISDLLNHLRIYVSDFDYDSAAKIYLAKTQADYIRPLCHAMFIDEAQDLGPHTLQLLTLLVEQPDGSNPNSRAVNVFYDNAQNLYGRSTPKWSEIGLDMRGRSFVMEESFRSTRPITELALNALYRLRPVELGGDHAELVERGLVERLDRGGEEWWSVRFNQIDGPMPSVRQFRDVDSEFDAIATQLVHWIAHDGVRPTDICVIFNGKPVQKRLEDLVAKRLRKVGARLEVQVSAAFRRDANTVVATTPHSYKGYESEVVLVAGADSFVAKQKGVLANNLYVAMTRARSVLAVYGVDGKGEGGKIIQVLKQCLNSMADVPAYQDEATGIDVAEELKELIGREHSAWLKSLMKQHSIELEPICAPDGEVIAEPLFWFERDEVKHACFAKEPMKSVCHRLDDAGVRLIRVGESLG